MNAAFSIHDLDVRVERDGDFVDIVRGVSLDVGEGEVVAVVGPSGSGKSATVLASLGLFPAYPGVVGGRVTVHGHDLLPPVDARPSRSEWRATVADQRRRARTVLGRHVGVLLQDPVGALDPQQPIGRQFDRTLRRNRPEWDRAKRDAVVDEWLSRMDLNDPRRVLNAVPFELSGGMCQRVMAAIVLSLEPEILVSDEATSALDALNAVAVLDSIVADGSSRSVLLITHDLGVAARYADRVVILVDGEIVHRATPAELLAASDESLPESVCRLRTAAAMLAPAPREGGADG